MGPRANSDLVSRLLAHAAGQSQVLTSAQMGAAGLGRKLAASMRREGWLVQIRPGAYLVGGGSPTDWQKVVAAALVAGPGAVVSHSTAARVHHFPHLALTASIELTVTDPRQPRPAGVQVHRAARLDPLDVSDHRGVPVTDPARTICDLAARLPRPLLARVIDEGLVQRMWTLPAVSAALDRAGPRAGTRTLRSILAERREDEGAESALEQRAARILAPFQPFELQYQLIVDGQVCLLDIAWPEWRVAVECDGFGPHGLSREKFDRDRRRGNLLLALGWSVVHFTSVMTGQELLSDVGRLLPARISGHLSSRAS